MGAAFTCLRALGLALEMGAEGGLQCDSGVAASLPLLCQVQLAGSRVKAAQPAGCHLDRSGREWARANGGGGRERPDSGSIC